MYPKAIVCLVCLVLCLAAEAKNKPPTKKEVNEQLLQTRKLFDGKVYNSYKKALRAAKKTGKPVFAFIYDRRDSKTSNLKWSLGYALETAKNRKLFKDNFVQAILDRSAVKTHLTGDYQPEHVHLLIISPEEKILLNRPYNFSASGFPDLIKKITDSLPAPKRK
ncbi:hypothetical protein LCGC14_2383660 [marine sediment metagenome]|uniref:Uncharacterized protein n=1 Tax=marine sediment metagenome TaxID=412755 RepID=A0A0F9C076_9ZZZZ